VAKAAGVSVSTVSRVLNGKHDVALETIAKVQAVIQELGYTSSLAARGMRSHRTNVLGLIMPDIANPYCVLIMRGVNYAVAQMAKDLLIYTNCDGLEENAGQRERSYVALLNGGVADGVVVVTPTATDFTSQAPLVIVDPNHENPDCPAIISTNREGALAVMNYLTGLGHRRIGHISGRMDSVSAIQRMQGYKDGLAAVGVPFDEQLVEIGNYRTEQAVVCARRLLALENRPTAIFAANDMSAVGVYRAAQEVGLRIPQDLSVVGFDNVREATLLFPALTTVDQSVEDMGRIAMEMIIKLVNDEKLPSKRHIIQTQFIVRDSCGPLP
jgi:LacI family transcriptional regulator